MTQAIIGETTLQRTNIDPIAIAMIRIDIQTIKLIEIDLEIGLAVRTDQTETLEIDQDQTDIKIIYPDQDQKITIEITIEMIDMTDHINLDHITTILETNLETDRLEIEVNQMAETKINLIIEIEVSQMVDQIEIAAIVEAKVTLEADPRITIEKEAFLITEIILDRILYHEIEILRSKDIQEGINQMVAMIADNQGHFREIDRKRDRRIKMAIERTEIHQSLVMPQHGAISLDMHNASLDLIVIHNIIQSHKSSVISAEFLDTIRSAV